jgi:cGMP-dependent protein kinase
MCGGVPFAEVKELILNYFKDAEDPYEIYEEIIKKPLTYPSFVKDRKAKKIMD